MAAYVQDAIMLLGDSITQGGYELDGFAARLSRTSSNTQPSCTDILFNGLSAGSSPFCAVQTCTTERWTS